NRICSGIPRGRHCPIPLATARHIPTAALACGAPLARHRNGSCVTSHTHTDWWCGETAPEKTSVLARPPCRAALCPPQAPGAEWGGQTRPGGGLDGQSYCRVPETPDAPARTPAAWCSTRTDNHTSAAAH